MALVRGELGFTGTKAEFHAKLRQDPRFYAKTPEEFGEKLAYHDARIRTRIADYFWHLALPLVCLTIGSFAVTTMLTKNTFVEEIRKQYVLVARAKGLSQQRVLYKHIFRNALIPLVTGFPAAFVGAFFAGSVLIETLFSLDGLGLLGYEAVIRRDYPVVLGALYLFTLIGLVVKLVSDLLYRVVDPRVQFGSVAK